MIDSYLTYGIKVVSTASQGAGNTLADIVVSSGYNVPHILCEAPASGTPNTTPMTGMGALYFEDNAGTIRLRFFDGSGWRTVTTT